MPAIDDMLKKVQALLRQADHPNTSATEAQTFRNKAEALMMRYRIDEAMLAQRPESGIAPKWREMTVCAYGSEFRYYYEAMARSVINHVGARGVIDAHRDGSRESELWTLRYTFVGFESDLHLVEMLYTECMLTFQGRLEPGFNPAESDQINAFRMRRGGMEWNRICETLWGTGTAEHKYRLRARRLFLRECEIQGEDPSIYLGMGTNMRIFRESYANGFVSELSTRLWRMRTSGGLESKGLVLAGRKEAIDNAFYERYPQYAPPKPLPTSEEETEEASTNGGVARDHTRGNYVDPRSVCGKCQKAKSGYCRDHAYMRPSTAAYRESAYNHAASDRGRQAARSVDIGATPGGRSLR